MIEFKNTEVMGWDAAIRGMRNPMNSWDRIDSGYDEVMTSYDCEQCIPYYEEKYVIGPNDLDLMKRLRNAGADHAKYRRMITVYVDITAPLYWWKEFKTYRNGRRFGDDEPDLIPDEYLEYDIEMNSCSTMHKIHAKEFTLEDFSHEHLRGRFGSSLKNTVVTLNQAREAYLETKDKEDWWQMIQLLPSSYNQKRTVMLNYEVLANMYHSRKNHKLDEWRMFCDWIKALPYSEIITGEE